MILGHSERRELLGESDDLVAAKAAYALHKGLKVCAQLVGFLRERFRHLKLANDGLIFFRLS